MPEDIMDKLRTFLLALPRRQKRIIQVAADVVLVWAALWMAFVVRLGIEDLINPLETHTWLFICAPIVAIPLFIRIGLYRAVMRYFGNDALIAIIKAVSLSALILGCVVYFYSNHKQIVPRSHIFIRTFGLGTCFPPIANDNYQNSISNDEHILGNLRQMVRKSTSLCHTGCFVITLGVYSQQSYTNLVEIQLRLSHHRLSFYREPSK